MVGGDDGDAAGGAVGHLASMQKSLEERDASIADSKLRAKAAFEAAAAERAALVSQLQVITAEKGVLEDAEGEHEQALRALRQKAVEAADRAAAAASAVQAELGEAKIQAAVAEQEAAAEREAAQAELREAKTAAAEATAVLQDPSRSSC